MFNVFSLSVLFLYLKFCTLYATPKNPKREEKGEKNPLIVNEIQFKAVCDNFTYFQVKCDSQLIC